MKTTMKTLLIACSALSLILLAGCRREDVREVTIEVPSLAADKEAAVKDAFVIKDARDPRRNRYYDGIYPDSFRFDHEKKTVTLSYDSMKIAHTNIRMLIRDRGFEVVFPTNTTGRAGY